MTFFFAVIFIIILNKMRFYFYFENKIEKKNNKNRDLSYLIDILGPL
jgi:hypothetical protein